jgi:hypothetical protein
MKRLFFLLFILPGVFALGISPVSQSYEFSPGADYDGHICIIGGEGKNISLSLSNNELITEIEFDRNYFIPTEYSDCVNYTFKTDYFVDSNIDDSIYLYAEETVSESTGTVFGVRIGQKLMIDTTNAPINEDVPKRGINIVIIASGIFILSILILLVIRRKRN